MLASPLHEAHLVLLSYSLARRLVTVSLLSICMPNILKTLVHWGERKGSGGFDLEIQTIICWTVLLVRALRARCKASRSTSSTKAGERWRVTHKGQHRVARCDHRVFESGDQKDEAA